MVRLFVGDDWAESNHDIELVDAAGRRMARARLPEGVAGMERLHSMIAEQIGEVGDQDVEVVVGKRHPGNTGRSRPRPRPAVGRRPGGSRRPRRRP
jgi:hypothetical protein